MASDAHTETVNRVVSILREERRRQGISEEKFARLAGVSRGGIRHVESSEVRPTLYTLLKMAEALHLDFVDVIEKAHAEVRPKRANP